MKQELSNPKKLAAERIIWGRITAIYADDTGDVIIVDKDKKDTAEKHTKVIFFYNCQADMALRSNGAIEGSSSAFQVNDIVYVKFSKEDNGDKTDLRIVGRLDGLKTCGLDLVLVIVDDSKFLTYDDDQDKIKYYTHEYKIKHDMKLTKLPAPTANISKNGNGLVLVMQGSEDGNASLAMLPNKFTFFEFWDIRDDGTECRWGVTVQLFMGTWSCVMGAKLAYNPMQGLANTFSGRTNYVMTADNQTATKTITAQTGVEVFLQENIKSITVKSIGVSTGYTINVDYTVNYEHGTFTVKSGGAMAEGEGLLISYSYLVMTCYYKLNQTILGQGLYYGDDLQPTYRNTSKYTMQYKTNPGGPFVGTALISQDYETPDPFADGYEWQISNPVVAVSDTEALVLSVRRLQVKSPYIPRTYGYVADFTVSSVEWGVCYEPGHCYLGGQNHYGRLRTMTSTYHATGTVSLRKEQIKYTEELKIGDEVILSLILERKSETGFNEGGGINIWPMGTVVSSSIYNDCTPQADGHVCGIWDMTCPDNFNGGVTSGCEAINRAFPTTSGTCGAWGHPGISGAAIVVPGNAKPSSITGSGGIHILGMANSNGKQNRIIIYQYTEFNVVYNVDGTSSSKVTTKYIVDIKTSAVTVKETAAAKTVEDGTTSGNWISRVSCQINAGILVYTYCKSNEAGAFVSRKIKAINISNSFYPAAATYETEDATDMDISAEDWPRMLAIGITK